MCGLCGVFNFRKGVPVIPSSIEKMVNILRHRGPDESGLYCRGRIGLGSCRLSIIDLKKGHQPLHNEDNSIWIVCNGEIYNYLELRDELKKKGHTFYTKSDTEVIVHLYEKYGERCLDYLNGIFAFAIWNKRKKKLFLARDRLGVKPLFYYRDKDKLIFASEIKAILQEPTLKREVNQEALYHFLSLNYIPSPLTIFKNIYSLPAGHMLMCSDKNFKVLKYWDVSFEETYDLGKMEFIEQLKDYLDRSIKMQLISDVPIGAFLSGGIDSSTIVNFIRENSNEAIKTFNVRFQEPSYDESCYATQASKLFNTQHYEIFCKPQDYINFLPKIIRHADNLTTDVSMLPLYLVSQLASQHVKVVLSGDGADELFAGYSTYAADKLACLYRYLPGVVTTKLIPSLVSRLPLSSRKMSFEFKAKRFIQGVNLSPEEAHYSWRTIFSEEEKKKLLVKDFLNDSFRDTFQVYRKFYQDTYSWETLSRHQYADMKVWLVDSILAKVDSMSMANSLEVRVPFLDHRLVEFAAKIPAKLKLNGLVNKYILKRAMKDKLPSSILKRTKAGFDIPIGKWLRTDLKKLMTDILNKTTVDRVGYFNWEYIKKLMDDHSSLKRDNGFKLLGLIHFSLWHDFYIKG